MTQPVRRRYTHAEYLDLETFSNVKHEFLDGEIYAMAGGTVDHAALAMAVGRLLGNALEGRPCRVFSSDLRVRVLATGLATYPDVSVVCGPVERDPGDRHAVTNPIVIVEVLSESTADYDRGEKFEHYRRLASLREYALIDSRGVAAEARHRTPDGSWSAETAGPGGRVSLPSLALALALAVDDLYRDGLLGA
jgi:Uma2 family endonuclease